MKVILSLASGVLAALASVAGKFAFDEDLEGDRRAVALILLLGFNSLMLHTFVRALRVDGSIIGTTLNTCANVLTTSAVGYVLLGENQRMTSRWLAGAFLVVAGIACVTQGTIERHLKTE